MVDPPFYLPARTNTIPMGFRRKLLNSLDDFAGGFSSESYACEIATLNQAQLTALHKRMLQKLLGTMALAAISIAGASATVGVSAVIGSAVAARRFHLNCQRILVVEARLREEGWDDHNFRKRDMLVALGPSFAAGALLPGAGHVVSHIAHAGHATAHHAVDTVAAAAHAHPHMHSPMHRVTKSAVKKGTKYILDTSTRRTLAGKGSGE